LFFFQTTIVSRTRLDVTLYVECLFCWNERIIEVIWVGDYLSHDTKIVKNVALVAW